MIQIGVRDPWFTHLVEGRKKVEGKKDSPTWSFLKDLDLPTDLLMNNEKEGDEYREWLFQITDVRVYPSVRNYLEMEGLKTTLPGVNSIDDGVRLYEGFSSPEELAKYNFLAIEVVPIERTV